MADDQDDSMFCADDRLAALVDRLQSGEQGGMDLLHDLRREFPDDPRLLFLDGSLMAGRRDYAGAEEAMRRAVDLAPDFALARFQLGFLQLTSGEPYRAQESWGPLHGFPADHYLRHFVEGLCHLIRDEFPEAVARLQQGIAANQENAPLNTDMMLIVTEIGHRDMSAGMAEDDAGASSSAQFLLQQASLKGTRH